MFKNLVESRQDKQKGRRCFYTIMVTSIWLLALSGNMVSEIIFYNAKIAAPAASDIQLPQPPPPPESIVHFYSPLPPGGIPVFNRVHVSPLLDITSSQQCSE